METPKSQWLHTTQGSFSLLFLSCESWGRGSVLPKSGPQEPGGRKLLFPGAAPWVTQSPQVPSLGKKLEGSSPAPEYFSPEVTHILFSHSPLARVPPNRNIVLYTPRGVDNWSWCSLILSTQILISCHQGHSRRVGGGRDSMTGLEDSGLGNQGYGLLPGSSCGHTNWSLPSTIPESVTCHLNPLQHEMGYFEALGKWRRKATRLKHPIHSLPLSSTSSNQP